MQADGVIYSERRCIEDTKRYNVYHIDKLIKKTRVPVENIGEYIASRDKPVAKVNIFFPTAEIRDEVVEKIKDINYDLRIRKALIWNLMLRELQRLKDLWLWLSI